MYVFWVAVLAYVVLGLGNVLTQLKRACVRSRRGGHTVEYFWFGDIVNLIMLIGDIGPRCPHGGGVFFGRALPDYCLRRENFEKPRRSGTFRQLRAF